MAWWNGDGAARVLAHEGDALLMERATGDASLAETARGGRDDDASRITLHSSPAAVPPRRHAC
jgi:streptomycin 6-kinase